MSYQQANWNASGDADFDGVWDGRLAQPNIQQVRPDNYLTNQRDDRVFTNQWGQRCRIICDPPPRPPPRPSPRNPQQAARLMIGRPLSFAQQIYPDVRVVIDNGRRLPVTQDFRPTRINVEVRTDLRTGQRTVIRIDGFY